MAQQTNTPTTPTYWQRRALVRSLERRFGQSVMPYEFRYVGCSIAEGEHWRVTDVETGSFVQGVFFRGRLSVRRTHDGNPKPVQYAEPAAVSTSVDEASAERTQPEAVEFADYLDGCSDHRCTNGHDLCHGGASAGPECPHCEVVDASAMVPQVCQQQQANAGAYITTEADIVAAQRATLARQHAELQARMALARAGRSPAQLQAQADRIIADLADALSECAIDAYHDGLAAFVSGSAQPYEPGALADAWSQGKRDAQRASRRRVAAPVRAEGFYHSRVEVL